MDLSFFIPLWRGLKIIFVNLIFNVCSLKKIAVLSAPHECLMVLRTGIFVIRWSLLQAELSMYQWGLLAPDMSHLVRIESNSAIGKK